MTSERAWNTMGLLDRLLGRDQRHVPKQYANYGAGQQQRPPAPRAAVDSDEAAIERYRYLLRTAPPETIEQAHAEAFAKLTPEQRRQVLADVGSGLPEAERARTDDPRDLARMATRAELRQPGTMERALGGGRGMGGGMGMGMGMGGMIAGSLLASVAGAFIGTAIADQFFGDEGDGGDGGEGDGGDAQAAEDSGGDAGDAGGAEADAAGDTGGDAFGGDLGGFDGGFDSGGFDGGGFGDF